jgi:hypothetical protein
MTLLEMHRWNEVSHSLLDSLPSGVPRSILNIRIYCNRWPTFSPAPVSLGDHGSCIGKHLECLEELHGHQSPEVGHYGDDLMHQIVLWMKHL